MKRPVLTLNVLAPVLALALVLPGHAQTSAGEFLVDRWSLEEGLPQSSVWALVQDGLGYLWIGTEEGVARFDGRSFTLFTPDNVPELPSQAFGGLLVASDGSLWGATRAGFVRFPPGHWQDAEVRAFIPLGGPASRTVRCLTEDSRGRIWAGSDDGVSRADPGDGGWTVRSWTSADGLPSGRIRDLLEDASGNVWAANERGLGRLVEDGDALRWRPFSAAPLAGVQTRALLQDSQGRLWAGTPGGVYQFEVHGDGERIVRTLAVDDARAFLESDDGGLWIGAVNGLFRWHAERGVSALSDSEFLRKTILTLLRDREGNIWAGSRFDGLLRLSERRIHVFGPEEGLGDEVAWVMLEDRHGNMWVGTQQGLVRRAPDGTVRTFLVGKRVRALFEDQGGRTWAGIVGEGVALRDGSGTFQALRLVEGRQPQVSAFAETPPDETGLGNLWVATYGGLFRHRGGDEIDGAWKLYGPADGLPVVGFASLRVDGDGALWIASTTTGLARYKDGTFTLWTKADGLGTDQFLSIYQDETADLWFGTWGTGLVRQRGEGFQNLLLHPELRTVHWMLDDGRGRFWMTSNRGLFSVDAAALHAWADGDGERPKVQRYGRNDGMPSLELNGGGAPAGWRRRDGTLWFPTLKGAAIVDPAAFDTPPLPPRAVIEQVTADAQAQDPRRGGVLPPGTRTLSIHYTAPTFVNANEVRYRYRLESFDPDWIDAGAKENATYTNLFPGTYSFRVQADTTGAWDGPEATYSFVVRPHFWATWWFRAFVVLAAVLLVWTTHRVHLRRLLQARELQLAQAKNSEMEHFLHTIAHDLKSPLFTVKGFLGMLRKDVTAGRTDHLADDLQRIDTATDKMGKMLEEILELARLGRVESHPEEVPAADVVGEALDAVAGRVAERGVEVDVADGLPVVYGDRARLVQVFQNLLENAVKYMGDQAAPRIEVRGRTSDAETVLSVADNGLGIAPEQREKVFRLFQKLNADSDGSGVGLALVHRVVELHGGRIWVESEGAGQGSTFFVALPRKAA